jgi:hypothetical protein
MDFTTSACGQGYGRSGVTELTASQPGELGRMNRLETAMALAISILALLVVVLGLAWVAVWELRWIIRTWNARGRH